jgi:protoporphyrin/coproporphyrin ferrochelatase
MQTTSDSTASTSTETIGVLLMAYGSPESVEDMEAYLLDIRGGRPTSPELVAEITERYEQIGGRSPLLDRTRQQAQALEDELNRRFRALPVRFKSYLGMRHWDPRIQTAVEQMADDGVQKVVALVMAPHSSRLSTGAYFSRLQGAIADQGAALDVRQVENWHAYPGFIESIAEKVEAALPQFDQPPHVVFTAHSLPARILSQGDPYDSQLRETCSLLAQRLGLAEGRWRFSYQSAGQSAEPWLGPQIEEVIVELAQAGETNLLIVPIGFVCDHVEVLYDIDIAGSKIAAEHGARLERSDSLNSSPRFISALADLIAAELPELEEDAMAVD